MTEFKNISNKEIVKDYVEMLKARTGKNTEQILKIIVNAYIEPDQEIDPNVSFSEWLHSPDPQVVDISGNKEEE
jgi:hypothetical protein